MKMEDLKCCGNCGYLIARRMEWKYKDGSIKFFCANIENKNNNPINRIDMCERWQWIGTIGE